MEVPAVDMLERVMDGVRAVAGDQSDKRVYLLDVPQPGAIAHRVGEIVVQSLDDANTYAVQEVHAGGEDTPNTLDLVGNAELRRTPKGEPGSWIAQAVVFDKATFTYADAVQWIARNGEGHRDFGAEEDAGFYRFPQYSPTHFAYFKQVTVAPGVAVVYGQIGQPSDAQQAKGERYPSPDAAHDAYVQVHDVAQRLSRDGMRVVKLRAEETAAEEHYILGIVLEPTLLEDGTTHPDTQGDVYTAKDVRDAAHLWLSHYGQVDLMHSWRPLKAEQVQVLESYLAPVDFDLDGVTVRKGTWLLALRVLDDDLWTAIKDGEIGAYSIGGTAQREPLDAPEETA